MIQPLYAESDQSSNPESSRDNVVHPPALDDLRIQDDFNLHGDSFRNIRRQHSQELGLGDLDGAIGLQSSTPEWHNISASRSYATPHSQNSVLSQRRHSSQELPSRRRSNGSLSHSSSDQFGPGNQQYSYRRERNMSRNLTAEQLTNSHSHLDIHYNYPPGIPQETLIMGPQLYVRFLQEEIQNMNLPPPEFLNSHLADSSNRNNEILNIGLQLRKVANLFANSEHRMRVREKAESVCLENLNYTTFSVLLYGLFQEGGVTSERVVVLFYFCSDLAIRALREKLIERFRFITEWSQIYIVEKFSLWVQDHGGWEAVLQQSINNMYKCAIICFCCVGIVAMFLYIRNNAR